MSRIIANNIRHNDATSDNITLDGSNNVTTANNFTAGGTIGCTGDLTVTSGNLVLSSGNGIDFSATGGPTNGTGSSELFDDYEEGTWTPELADADTGGNTVTHSTQNGLYTKVGNVVTAYFRVTWTSKASASGTVRLRGLPFTSKSNSGQYYYVGSTVNNNGQVSVAVTGNATNAIFYDSSGGAGSFAELSSSDTGNGMNGTVTYLAG